jgi:hypothetical protein
MSKVSSGTSGLILTDKGADPDGPRAPACNKSIHVAFAQQFRGLKQPSRLPTRGTWKIWIVKLLPCSCYCMTDRLSMG